MVQVLGDPALSPNGAPAHEAADGPLVRRPNLPRNDSTTISREEHAQRMRELNKKRAMMKAPRRGWSMTDYQVDNTPSHSSHTASSQVERQASIPENAPLPMPARPPSPVAAPVEEQVSQLPHRPKLPPPRRSYSVMDYEPIPPGQPQPPKDFTLLDLPSELHYAIFDFLDPIDSVCFGLTNSNFYDIHRRMHGAVPLSSRYSGPNDLEWAWRGAGPLVHPKDQTVAKDNAMDQMRVKGQIYCRKCGISRCELHRHVKSWMGEGYEYCSIKEMYGKPAGEDAKTYCYMKSPKNPHRCGRHGGKKTAAR
ncbi:hypothetical protein B0J13DRAFT_307550 [Dactylonectria estremocensis]|uniref:F-box domain-containing protein n=1 Tax=Dactylonectria estremocensis TaxID=1079267 RepID=A0A9P9J8N7_9HYPO|nr:hypothetical protein B0J13DRAFT_307550 [Dactylonectria estremocensis]